ncbi:hypothetical protein CLBKI_27110 [Clostridium beijerinckii]|nr:hypothetical protein CLBKI_27110 [Clostridium beijerinckii]
MSMPNKVTRCLDLISHIQKIIMATLDLLFVFMCLKQAISPSSANMIFSIKDRTSICKFEILTTGRVYGCQISDKRKINWININFYIII